jgi:hypothetical protein
VNVTRPLHDPRLPAGDPPVDVSFAEEQVWLAEQGGPPAVPFLECRSSMSMMSHVENSLDVDALTASLNEVVRRHDVLRSIFRATHGRLERQYAPSATVALTTIDLQDAPEADRADALQRVLAEQIRAPFDLASPPLLRPVLVRLRRDEQVLAITVPHIVFDRWSKNVLAHELKALYAAHITRSTPEIEPLSTQYRDYVRWQRERVAGSRGRTLVDYWRDRLHVPSSLQLPCDGDRTQACSTRSGAYTFTFTADDVSRLSELKRRSRVTMSTLMLAIVRVFTHIVCGEGDAAVGVPLTDRRRTDFEQLIGLFMNVVVVRTATVDRMTFTDVLDHVRRALVDASRHQDMPYGYLRRLFPDQGPLYRMLFSFMPELSQPVAQLTGVRVTPMWIDNEEQAVVDLSIQMVSMSGRLGCRLVYRAELFSPSRVRRFADVLQAVVKDVLDRPDTPIGALRAA